MRYREGRELGLIAYHVPFEVVAPEIEIKAAEKAPAGGELDVRVTGNVSDYMRVTIVPTGSDVNMGQA